MKRELATAIGVAIVGTLISFFIANLFMGEINNFSFKTINSADAEINLDAPNPEVFNFRAINPTVEVYVGEEGN